MVDAQSFTLLARCGENRQERQTETETNRHADRQTRQTDKASLFSQGVLVNVVKIDIQTEKE